MTDENIILVTKLAECLSRLGIDNMASDRYIKYFKGEVAELDSPDVTKNIDMANLQYDVQHIIRNTFEAMRDTGNARSTDRFMQIMINAGGCSFFNVISYLMHGFSRSGIDELMKYDIPKWAVICWMLEESVDREFVIKLFVIDKLDEIYMCNKALFNEVFEQCGINARVYLSAYLVHKDKKMFKEQREWLEKVIKNSLDAMFNKKLTPDEIEKMIKYIDGGFIKKDSIISELVKTVDFGLVNAYLLQFLTGIAYIIFDNSDKAARFLKSMILMNYEKSLSAVYKCIKNDTYSETAKIIPYSFSEAMSELDIPEELYIAWMGSWSCENNGEFDKQIKEQLKTNRKVFDKAANLNANWGTVYLNKFLWDLNENKESFNYVENIYIKMYESLFSDLTIPQNIYKAYIDFLFGKKELEEVKDSARKVLGKQTVYTYRYKELLERVFWTRNVSDLYNRSICLFVYSRSNNVIEAIAHDVLMENRKHDYQKYLEVIKNSGAGKDGIMPFLTEYACGQYYSGKESARAFIEEEISNNAQDVVQYLADCSADGRTYLLEKLFNSDRAKYVSLLLKYTSDSSKAVREKIINLLGEYSEAFDEVAKLLSDKKLNVRECGVHILSIWNDEKSMELLHKAMENEKSDKLKTSIANILKITALADEDEPKDINIIDYCIRESKKTRGTLAAWLDFESLPVVRLINSEDIADKVMLKYLILSYASNNVVGSSLEAKKVSKYLSDQDLADVALEVINLWLENGAESKKKWILSLAAVHGDDRVVNVLKKKIEEWPQHSRGAIACDAVYALALNGSSQALMIIDNISRKFKFRQVKEAAAGAFAFAAGELGVDAEELSDKIVPNLGFDQRGERIFDFGSRKFKVVLGPELELEVYDENDKRLKNLPSVGKNDNEESAKQSVEEFKSLKKQLKTVSGTQSVRLETALSTNRKWDAERWNSLFVGNPIMHKYAIGLIWGTYRDGVLQDTFRYMEDGSFNTADEEEYELSEGLMIGLVHPVELDEEGLIKWKTQLEDYEVKQPFEQILRKVFLVTEEEQKEKLTERYGGVLINGLSLLGKMTKFGWYRGSVQDAGFYYNFYKEDKKIGIGAELQFSGVSVGYENEEVTLREIIFYKAGTVQRGSYIYDKVGDINLLKPADVPRRFFSEILYDIDRAAASRTGINTNWKKDS